MIGENRMFQVNVLIEILQEEEDCFTATCPQLGCIFVQEETLSDALFYAKEAIDLYFQSSIEHEDPVPDEVVISREVSEVSPTLPVKFNFASAYATSAVA